MGRQLLVALTDLRDTVNKYAPQVTPEDYAGRASIIYRWLNGCNKDGTPDKLKSKENVYVFTI